MLKTNRKSSGTSLLCELTKLKSQQKYLEATQFSLNPIANTPIELSNLNELENMKIEQKLNFPVYKVKLKNDAKHVTELIKQFTDQMMQTDSLPKYNTKQYREQIQLIDQKLRDIETNNVDELKQLKLEYCHIEGTLLSLNESNFLQSHSLSSRKSASKIMASMGVRHAMSMPIDKIDSDDVRQFDKFLIENKGHTGGWIDEEHFLFVRMKTKYKGNIENICNAIKIFFIDKTEEEIRAHHDWYEKYLELKLKRKNAIQNWKKSRMLRMNLHSA